MRRHPSIAILSALCWILAGSAAAPHAQAAEPNRDPVLARGEEIARAICATCHVVASDQQFPPLLDRPTPTFIEIANRPGTNAKAIQRFITTTHWDEKSLPMRMPNLLLTSRQSVAVSRYILSLRKP